MKYDLIVVGSGPSSVFLGYELIKLSSKKKVLIIEQGKKVEERNTASQIKNYGLNLLVILLLDFLVQELFLMGSFHYIMKKMKIFMLEEICINI